MDYKPANIKQRIQKESDKLGKELQRYGSFGGDSSVKSTRQTGSTFKL